VKEYAPQWRRYRMIYWRSFALSIVFFWGGLGGTVAAFGAWFRKAPPWLLFAAALPWLLAAIAASQAPVKWPCPRCGRPFFAGSWYHNGLASACVHCGLPKWAERDPD
jgi:hypothetical protein